MERKPVLGKGLGSLFPGVAPAVPSVGAAPENAGVIGGELVTSNTAPAPSAGAVAAGPAIMATPQDNRDRHPGISLSMLEDIHTNPYQPRREFDEQALEELAQSIRANGIIQPLVVRKRTSGGGWELIAGERRLRAAKIAGLKHVPIVIRRSTDKESLEIALVENIQRQNLNCIDEALAYAQLAEDFSLTQEEVATRVGKDRATVANFMRLLRLPEAIIDDLKKGTLTLGHGKALLGLDDHEARLQIRAQVIEKRLSVRDTEALVEQFKFDVETKGEQPATGAEAAKPLTPVQSRMSALAQELTRHWSARVDIKGSERRGKIVIHYGTRQELERILEAMKN